MVVSFAFSSVLGSSFYLLGLWESITRSNAIVSGDRDTTHKNITAVMRTKNNNSKKNSLVDRPMSQEAKKETL